MAAYNQTVPEQKLVDDGCNWILDQEQQKQETNDMIMWNEIEETLKDKVDDEIRNLRHRIHHLLDERKMHCEYMLGINRPQQSHDVYQQEMIQENYNSLDNYAEIYPQQQQQQQQQQFKKPVLGNTSDTSIYYDEEEISGLSSQYITQTQSCDSNEVVFHESNDAYVIQILTAVMRISNNVNKVLDGHHNPGD